jgi:hypothetical protein
MCSLGGEITMRHPYIVNILNACTSLSAPDASPSRRCGGLPLFTHLCVLPVVGLDK